MRLGHEAGLIERRLQLATDFARWLDINIYLRLRSSSGIVEISPIAVSDAAFSI